VLTTKKVLTNNIMIIKLEKARIDNWTKRKFFDGTSAKLGPSLDEFGRAVTGLEPAEEKKFEKELGLPPGTLAKGSDYWNDFMIVVDADGARFNDEVAEDRLKIKFLKAQSLVAEGTGDLLKNPKAEYVLFSEEHEQAERNKKRRLKNKVLRLVSGMDLDELRGMVFMYGHNPTGMTEEAVEDFIYERAEDDPSRFDLLANDPSKADKVFVHKLVKAGILAPRGGAYLYNDENLGYGLDAVALMLKDKKHQELRIALEKQLIDA
jgi:hypothetical protein